MSKPSAFSPDVSDPFYVPDRTSEMVSFAGAALLAMLMLLAPLFVAPNRNDAALLIGMALFILGFLFKGLRARQNRLCREQEVRELRRRLATESEWPINR